MMWLNDILNKKKLINALAFVMVGFVFSTPSSFALTKNYSDYCGFLADNREKTATKEYFDTDETKKKVEQVNKVEEKVEKFCEKYKNYLKTLKKEGREFGGTKEFDEEIYRQQGFFKTAEVEDFDVYNAKFDEKLAHSPTLKKEYDALQEEYKNASEELQKARSKDEETHRKAVEAGEYQPCGPKFPRGCPEGKKCYRESTRMVGSNRDAQNTTYQSNVSYACLDPNSKDAKKKKYTEVKQGEETNEVLEIVVSNGSATRATTTETGEKTVENLHKLESNCNIQAMQETYQSKCYSCVIVKTLIETFLTACATAYDVTAEAGVKLLTLGALIWMAFFIMKNVSSLANVEPGAMVNTLAVTLFKVMVAYIAITSGLGVLVKYFVNPFLTAGAEFGLALMSTTSGISGAVDSQYLVKVATVTAEGGKEATEIISADVINKIMLFTQSLDKTVSTHMVVGHAITCHSMNAGAWDLKIVQLVNLWLWFCGALIWFVGFMLTLGICFYLLDISFKLGFAIMALPIVLGLWPFNITKGKLTAVFSIILKSAATFAFLALTTTYALVLINQALRDIPTLLDKIKNEETKWISDTFSISGPYFLIILFAYLYSMNLISATIKDYVDKFFQDNVFGDKSPMHDMSTQAVSFAKQKVTSAGKSIGNKAADALKEEAKEKTESAKRFVKGLFKGKANGDAKGDNKGGGGSGGGSAVKGSGQAMKASGAAMEKTGQGVEKSGKMAEQGGKAVSQGGDGLMKAGKGLSSTGLGAIVGVPMMIAGAAMKAGGKTVEVAGKGAQKMGQAMKKSGKTMKKAGEKMEKAGEKMQKAGKKLQFGDRGEPANNEAPAESNNRTAPAQEKPQEEPMGETPPQPAPAEETPQEPAPEPQPALETPPAENK